MNSIKCPYCGQPYPQVPANRERYTSRHGTYESLNGNFYALYFSLGQCSQTTVNLSNDPESYTVEMSRCPACGKDSIHFQKCSINNQKVEYIGDKKLIQPSGVFTSYPDYIPAGIRSDYAEAALILSLSPKASATLSRRCLQGMIRDFWGIRKNQLIDEIDELNGKIPAAQWQAINALRKIGNIGAHMEKDVNTIVDVDKDEAEQLIKLIEILMKQWYIDRHEQELLYNDIVLIKDKKEQEKKPGGTSTAT